MYLATARDDGGTCGWARVEVAGGQQQRLQRPPKTEPLLVFELLLATVVVGD